MNLNEHDLWYFVIQKYITSIYIRYTKYTQNVRIGQKSIQFKLNNTNVKVAPFIKCINSFFCKITCTSFWIITNCQNKKDKKLYNSSRRKKL